MAGSAGFEPAYDGTKTRCLTTWRRPNIVYDGVNYIKYFPVTQTTVQPDIIEINHLERNFMAKHKSWHGADIKRARKKKIQAEKRKKA